MSSQRIPSRAWALLFLSGIAGMLFYVDRQTLSVLKPTLKIEYNWTDTHYSWLVAAYMVPYTLCYLVTGQLIDRWGTRLMMPLFLGVMSLASLASGISDSLWTLGLSRFFLGAAEAGIVPLILVAIVTWFPANLRGTANSANKPLTVAGQILVVPFTAWVTIEYSWRLAFIIPGIIGLVAALCWWLTDRNPPPFDHTNRTDAVPSLRAVIKNKGIRGLIIARLISDPLWFFFVFWQPGFLQEKLGMPLEKFGQVGWIPSAAAVGFIMLLGATSDWMITRGVSPVTSRARILTMTAILAPAVLALRWVDHHGLALALLTLIHIMAATWFSMSGLMLSELVPRRMIGTTVAVISAFGCATGALFNLFAGPLIETTGYASLLMVGCLLHPIAAGVVWWYYVKKPRQPADLVTS